MRYLTPLVLAFFISFSLAACESNPTDTDPSVELEQLDPPAEVNSGQPRLHVDDNGQVLLSWIEPASDDQHSLRYAILNDGDEPEWSTSETVATGEEWFVNWADVPSVRTLPNGRMAAHYLVSNGPNVFAYEVRIAQSDGNEWKEAITPHQDGTQTEHGFVTLLPWGEDNLLAAWLDGRNMDLDVDSDDHGTGAMTFRGAILDAEGNIQQKDLIDDHVCECCPTSGVLTEDEAVIAYRDRTEDEIRNISLVRFDGEQWTDPYPLHDDGWEISGCPVNGPALASNGNHIVAAWFTAADGEPRVNAALSEDGGHTFSDPILLDGDGPSGQVGVTLLNDDSALVSWYGHVDDDSALRVRHLSPDGLLGEPRTVIQPMPSVRTGIPRIARSGDDIYFAWVERSENDGERQEQVRVAKAASSEFH